MIWHCDRCRYLFPADGRPERCEDCGSLHLRPATREEQLEYRGYRLEFGRRERQPNRIPLLGNAS